MATATKSSTPRLSELAKHVRLPSGVVATGWPAVREKCRDLGIQFRPWQHGAGQVILAKRADGKYAATIGGTGMSIPRQVGKTFLVGAIVFALCLLRPNLTVIWTAHRLRTSEETFKKMLAMSRRKRIAPHMLRPVLGSGEEAIMFRNGSRILFGARERGFGRGFDEVDVLIFDEAQILTDNALDDMIPATNQSRQDTGALLLFMGTPPKPTDPGEVFTRMRTEALSGADEDTGWIEFGADDGFEPTPSPLDLTSKDWTQIARANPSYPQDTPREAILRMRKKLSAESFPREGLGLWDEESKAGVLPGWGGLRSSDELPKPACIGLAVSIDREWSSIGACGLADGVLRVGGVDRREGTAWVVAEVRRITTEHQIPVVLDEKGPAADLLADLEDSGVEVVRAKPGDYLDACAGIYDHAKAGTIRHLGDQWTNAANLNAKQQAVGDRWRWGRKKGDVSMLEAVTLAAWATEHAALSGFNIW